MTTPSVDQLCYNAEDRETLRETLQRTGCPLEELLEKSEKMHKWAWEYGEKGLRIVVRNDRLRRQHGLGFSNPQDPIKHARETLSLFCHVTENLDKKEGWVLAALDENNNVTAIYTP